jgi:pyruvate/2-oxoglutarate dehydrogenase complex dihydrolipoamide acyltransferase (E2) component
VSVEAVLNAAGMYGGGSAGVRMEGAAGGRTVSGMRRLRVVRSPADPPPPTDEPLTQQVAWELGVDLATVRGTGRHGVITCSDVARAAGVRKTTAAVEAVAAEPRRARR